MHRIKIQIPLLIALLCLTLTACGEEKTELSDAVRPVKALKISAPTNMISRKFPGRAKASQEVTMAFEVTGKLNGFPVNVGNKVKKGDVLVTLDPRDFKNALGAAIAEEKRSQAQYERVKQAVAFNAVSKQDLSDAEARFEAAKANVGIKEKALDDTALTAPYDAVVVATYVENFENINPKQEIIRLVNATEIEMIVNIPEDLISRIERVEDVIVSFDTFPDHEIIATVKEIGTEASSTTRTYPVTLTMKQPRDIQILPGMAGKAWSYKDPTGIQPAAGGTSAATRQYEVPLSAIYADENGQEFSWIIDPERGTVSQTPVKSHELTTKGVFVTGLRLGDYIATAGVNILQEGQQVRILE